ncbi:MAG: hypothetical protein H6616_02815 [Ignavibacteria bacterium]|nr:hypothetical protein [Ignavibacteria bacterium]
MSENLEPASEPLNGNIFSEIVKRSAHLGAGLIKVHVSREVFRGAYKEYMALNVGDPDYNAENDPNLGEHSLTYLNVPIISDSSLFGDKVKWFTGEPTT